MTSLDFSEHIVVIAGGCGGIGEAVRLRLASTGSTVIVWDIADGADERIDLTGENAVSEAMARLLDRFGRIDVLVNAVGITGPTVNIEQYSFAEWRRVLDVNLTSTFLCCKAAIAPMRRQNAGRIVNLASIAGKEGNAGMTGYSAAKAGVIALTKSLGKELAATEIRVNAIAPAVIATDLVKQMSDDAYRNVLAKIPLGRAGRPEEVAAMVAWLASDECSFSTGAVFDLSGGRATY
ncbi:SDR family oxidoreductase [Bradyrhizobium sp. 956_D2_N1_5]|jgi:2-dehydro-3-deoxy-L-rhamnonate dehydrogenase (NAD+)|uniref:SDR family oxidoreductase n=1 Tax=unclassified Bradyrhizobium TaxID=2631580 RepID=UPI003836423D